MSKLLIAFASATLLLASSGIGKAHAATIANAGTLAPLTKSYAPAEEVAYYHRYGRRYARRAYRRGYGHGYPYSGYAYPAYPYYGYAYRPYGYGYGWRPGITIGIGRPWGWGW
jgi:hypothetical protein